MQPELHIVFGRGGGKKEVTHIFTEVSLSRQGNMGSPVLCSRLLFMSAPGSLEYPADQSLCAFSASPAVSVWLVAFNISEVFKLTL